MQHGPPPFLRHARRVRSLDQVGRLRREAGWSAYRLQRIAGVKDQTIRNIERAVCDRGCMTGTLARIAYPFGRTVREVFEGAER